MVKKYVEIMLKSGKDYQINTLQLHSTSWRRRIHVEKMTFVLT
jgi:hypothetical protein